MPALELVACLEDLEDLALNLTGASVFVVFSIELFEIVGGVGSHEQVESDPSLSLI